MRVVWLAIVGWSTVAFADGWGFGRGTTSRVVSAPGVVVNRAVALRTSVAAGSTTLELDGLVSPGDLLFVHQTSVARDAGAGAAGHFRLRRVVAATGTSATLDEALDCAFVAPGAQAVIVAEYSALTITGDAGVIAAPWDGATGGAVIVFVDGPLQLDGELSASGRGHRGAPAVLQTGGDFGCLEAETTAGSIYPPRGEGFERIAYGQSAGVVTRSTGGASGGCDKSGGGGGANAGVGGRGGDARTQASPGGAGGIAVGQDPFRRLFFGGGGGGGSVTAQLTAAGGAGGGLVFVRAREIVGAGRFTADGLAGALSTREGGGGGGGGGSVVVLAGARSGGWSASATGGRGANGDFGGCNDSWTGPGGGGGGGFIFLKPGGAPMNVANGLAGVAMLCGSTSNRAASPTTVGAPYLGVASDEQAPFVVSTDAGVDARAVSWTDPVDDARVLVAAPVLRGRAPPGAQVEVRFDLGASDATLANLDGVFTAQPRAPLSEGPHQATASLGPVTSTVRFIVDTTAPEAPVIQSPVHRSVLREPPTLIAGRARVGSSVTVLLDGAAVGTPARADATGQWTLAFAPELTEGDHRLEAFANDESGRRSPEAQPIEFRFAPRFGETPKVMTCSTASVLDAWFVVAVLALVRRRR